MANNDQPSPALLEVADIYFELQADWGITKHLGGIKATRELVELCHIDRDKYVLVVGCGVGTTPCYLAKGYACRVVGVDLSERMVDLSNKRAKKEGVVEMVEFRAADAQNLPFEDGLFDAVISESVNAFIPDKQKVVNEYTRVTKPGGYIGFDEITWIKEPPPKIPEYMFRTMRARFHTEGGWKEFLESAGLKEIIAKIHKINALEQWLDEMRQFSILDSLKAWNRFWSLFVKSPVARQFTREALTMPRSIFSISKYWGYGVFAGRKL
ncbi:class I SAM-dependent methyltransferase [Chloroflexota bacterium]